MASGAFDKTFGVEFLASVPRCPGVYRFYGKEGEVLYVGKAKDLRARLTQYRNARRIKAHRKMKRIVRESARIEIEVTPSEVEALILENALIQDLEPRFNVAGAFSFLYPSLGVKRTTHHLHLAYSTEPEQLQGEGFVCFGSYRSRRITRSGFDALVDLYSRLGHRETSEKRVPYGAWRRFRQAPKALDAPLSAFLLGESTGFLEEAILILLEKPDARSDASAVQGRVKELRRFYAQEAQKLRAILNLIGERYVAQAARDRAAIRAGFREEEP